MMIIYSYHPIINILYNLTRRGERVGANNNALHFVFKSDNENQSNTRTLE